MTLNEFCAAQECTKPDAKQMLVDCMRVFPVFHAFPNEISQMAIHAILNSEEVPFAVFHEYLHAMALVYEIRDVTKELGIATSLKGFTTCLREIARRQS